MDGFRRQIRINARVGVGEWLRYNHLVIACDAVRGYHGSSRALQREELAPARSLQVTPGGNQAGIWMSDQAPRRRRREKIYLPPATAGSTAQPRFGARFLG